ncbi:MAG: hypothetical protein CMA27_04720 [Euryarchaeota archaeon]|nr:hypothetical protein [Euryarchaeota archaeon]|tara:strand:- start:828 stop:2072 length:1245 start_codon:yes stop_codon:yes gene_type:complete
MNKDYYTSPKPNFIMRFLWKAAGADSYLLEKSTYTDHVKYACLGGIVLATGFMAALAGGYAFYIVFSPKAAAISADVSSVAAADFNTTLLAIIFGCIWGLIIFNIDRFIVASTGKGDGTEAITSGEIKAAVPRIIMGIIIAITISKPVELRMFKTEIDVQLQEEQQTLYNEYKKNVEAKFIQEIDRLEGERAKLEGEIADKSIRLVELENQLTQEIQGRVGSQREGYGPAARRLENQIARAKQEYDDIQIKNIALIAEIDSNLGNQRDDKQRELDKTDSITNNYNGLNARLKIAHELVDWKIILFITLLFMSIELTPIFFKMMLIKSPYDFMNDNIKALIRAEKGIEIKHDFYKDKKGVHRDLIINHQSQKLLKEKIKLLQAQAELNEVVVESWKTKEIKNIQQNPENYINKES